MITLYRPQVLKKWWYLYAGFSVWFNAMYSKNMKKDIGGIFKEGQSQATSHPGPGENLYSTVETTIELV